MRVAVGMQQARLGGEQCARAALENHLGLEQRQSKRGGDLARDGVVEVERRVLAAPRVVAPVDDGARAGFAHDKLRPVVAAPRFVRPERMKLHLGQRHARGLERALGQVLEVGVPNVDVYRLALGDQPHKPGQHRRHDVVASGETDAVRPWPSEPCGGVRLPLGRHAPADTGCGGWVGIRNAQVRAGVFRRRRPSIGTIPRATTAGRPLLWPRECARDWCCQ